MTGWSGNVFALGTFRDAEFLGTRLSDCDRENPVIPIALPDGSPCGEGDAMMAQLAKRISKGLLGAVALSITFGAVASGRDLGHQVPARVIDVADASSGAINRAAKSDRASITQVSPAKTQTFSMSLNDLTNTSVLIRLPMSRALGNAAPASLLVKSVSPQATVACEPSVSVLTEVAKSLQPGRCIT